MPGCPDMYHIGYMSGSAKSQEPGSASSREELYIKYFKLEELTAIVPTH